LYNLRQPRDLKKRERDRGRETGSCKVWERGRKKNSEDYRSKRKKEEEKEDWEREQEENN